MKRQLVRRKNSFLEMTEWIIVTEWIMNQSSCLTCNRIFSLSYAEILLRRKSRIYLYTWFRLFASVMPSCFGETETRRFRKQSYLLQCFHEASIIKVTQLIYYIIVQSIWFWHLTYSLRNYCGLWAYLLIISEHIGLFRQCWKKPRTGTFVVHESHNFFDFG